MTMSLALRERQANGTNVLCLGFLVAEGTRLRRGGGCSVSLRSHLPGHLCMLQNECGLASHSGHFYHNQ